VNRDTRYGKSRDSRAALALRCRSPRRVGRGTETSLVGLEVIHQIRSEQNSPNKSAEQHPEERHYRGDDVAAGLIGGHDHLCNCDLQTQDGTHAT
jgi:hypothetical protein